MSMYFEVVSTQLKAKLMPICTQKQTIPNQQQVHSSVKKRAEEKTKKGIKK